tara:strand:- start:39 stop:590 length:552 start_codon:yes stop_codon:yes gene_type:complete
MAEQTAVAEQTNDAFQSSVLSEDFIQYMKDVENRNFSSGPVHESREGGNPTYGFGHKLTNTEKLKGEIYNIPLDEIDEEKSNTILMKDLKKANDILSKNYGQDYINLDPRRKQMLIDFQYNMGAGGVKKFKNFRAALFTGDEEGMKAEHIRGFYPSQKDRDNKTNFQTLARNKDFINFFFPEN